MSKSEELGRPGKTVLAVNVLVLVAGIVLGAVAIYKNVENGEPDSLAENQQVLQIASIWKQRRQF